MCEFMRDAKDKLFTKERTKQLESDTENLIPHHLVLIDSECLDELPTGELVVFVGWLQQMHVTFLCIPTAKVCDSTHKHNLANRRLVGLDNP